MTASKTKYVVIITSDNGDPMCYGPYGTPKKASAAVEKIQKRWGDYEWGHSYSASVREMYAPSSI